MTTQQIRGEQIKSAVIVDAHIGSGAAIALSKLAQTVIQANGAQAFTADQSIGNFKLTSIADAISDTDVPSFGQIKAMITGKDWKDSVDVATTAAGTLASSFANGSTIDGQTLVTGWRILIKDQSTGSENGIYTVNASGAPTRATDADSNAEVTSGLTVPVVRGTANGGTNWQLTTAGTITLGSTALTFNQVGETLTVDSSLVRTGHQLGRAALTGDVTASAGSNATTIASAAVSLAKLANLAANSVIANNTGSSATPTALGLTAAPTVSTVVLRDANGNTKNNSTASNVATTATAAGTTTLTVASAQFQEFTGSTTQTVVLPDATLLVTGQSYVISNQSTGVVTVNANGGGLIRTIAALTSATVTLIAAGSAAGTWDPGTTAVPGSGDASTNTATSVDSEVVLFSGTGGKTLKRATGSGLAKLTSGVLSIATVSTDYLASSSRITRETPSGSVNGSNTAFTLANTPIAGTEEVYLNGIQQEPGAGNDYTISGTAITYLAAPVSGDKIRVSYFK